MDRTSCILASVLPIELVLAALKSGHLQAYSSVDCNYGMQIDRSSGLVVAISLDVIIRGEEKFCASVSNRQIGSAPS